jgi:hypothetical protein
MAKRELVIVGGIVAAFALLLFPALLHARREARDGIRRTEIAHFKQALEHYYNEHTAYPLQFDASPHRYVVVTSDKRGATAWYLQAALENKSATFAGYDAEAERNYGYRVISAKGTTLYEVCGGTPTCDLDDAR